MTPGPCARCAATSQKACCVSENIVLTHGDIGRIAAHLNAGDFFERRVLEGRAKLSDPPWDATVCNPRGALVLRNAADRCCWFLGDRGCSLPMDVKPLVCRLYPYDDFTEHTINDRPLRGEANCPQEFFDEAPGGDLGAYIGVTHDDAVTWHRQLYIELELMCKVGR